MQKRGFLSFVLVLLFIPLLLAVQQNNIAISEKIANAENFSLQAAKANMLRTEIELNMDEVIRATIKREIESENWNTERILDSVAEEISGVVSKYRERGVEFYFVENFFRKYSELVYAGKSSEITKEKIKETSTIIIEIENKKLVVKFEITGGILKNELLVGKIKSKNYSQIFVMPLGYTVSREWKLVF